MVIMFTVSVWMFGCNYVSYDTNPYGYYKVGTRIGYPVSGLTIIRIKEETNGKKI